MTELLAAGPAVATYAILDGPAFSLSLAVLSLWDLRERAPSPGILIDLGSALQVPLPLAWTATDLAGFVSQHPLASNPHPTPFLPFLFRLEGWLRVPSSFTPQDHHEMRAYAQALAIVGANHPDSLPAVAGVLADVVRLCVRVTSMADAQIVLQLAQQALARYRPASVERISAAPDVLEAEYELECSDLERDDLSEPDERTRACTKAFRLLDRMAIALRARSRVFQSSTSEVVRRELRRSSLVARHRRLLWEEAQSREASRHSVERSKAWREIAIAYLKLGDVTHAAVAAANGLDSALDALERGTLTSTQLRVALGRLLRALERLGRLALARTFPSEHVLSALKASVRGSIAVQDVERADHWLAAAAFTMQSLLEGADAYRRSVLLRDADDWLGLAAHADRLRGRLPGSNLQNLYELVRGRPFARAPMLNPDAHIRALLSRRGSAFFVEAPFGSSAWLASGTHELAIAHDQGFRRGRFEGSLVLGGNAKEPRLSWDDVRRRYVGHLRLHRLRSAVTKGGCANARRVLVETDGHGVHIPWLSALLDAEVPIESVLVHVIDGRSAVQSVPPAAPAIVIDAFPAKDRLLKAFMARVAQELGTNATVVSDRASLRHALALPAPLIVLGCHGSRTKARGDLLLQLDTVTERAEDLLDSFSTAPSAPTIVALTCFAGDGFPEAGGEWRSLPQLLLKAGARAVVASMTPGWVQGAGDPHLLRLIKECQIAAGTGDLWGLGGAVAAYAARRRSRGDEPKYWVGWSTWT